MNDVAWLWLGIKFINFKAYFVISELDLANTTFKSFCIEKKKKIIYKNNVNNYNNNSIKSKILIYNIFMCNIKIFYYPWK